jgi:hypothetical protein
VKGGYIININPMANGILVVPLDSEFIHRDEPGKKFPILTPTIMAKKIQSVRYLSKKLNFLRSFVGKQFVTDIFNQLKLIVFLRLIRLKKLNSMLSLELSIG